MNVRKYNLAAVLDENHRAALGGTEPQREAWYNTMNVLTRYSALAAKVKDNKMMLRDLMELLDTNEGFEADIVTSIIWATLNPGDEYGTWHLDRALGLIDMFNKRALNNYIGLKD